MDIIALSNIDMPSFVKHFGNIECFGTGRERTIAYQVSAAVFLTVWPLFCIGIQVVAQRRV
eukprot:5126118-Prymnesium_polylepis.1